jgi:hypothetical protein
LRRIVRGTVLVTVCSITMAGCGADPPRRRQAARLTTAVLSARDLPPDFLPAEDQQVFGRVRPKNRDCRRLLSLADLHGLGDTPPAAQAHAVFYRTNPGSTVAEHLLALTPERARRHIEDTRQAASGCPRIRLGTHGVRLLRVPLRPPGPPGAGDSAYGVRYSGRVGPRYSVHFDLIMIREGARLLVVTQPALIDGRHPEQGDSTLRIVAAALLKLRRAGSPPGRAPLGRPVGIRS